MGPPTVDRFFFTSVNLIKTPPHRDLPTSQSHVEKNSLSPSPQVINTVRACVCGCTWTCVPLCVCGGGLVQTCHCVFLDCSPDVRIYKGLYYGDSKGNAGSQNTGQGGSRFGSSRHVPLLCLREMWTTAQACFYSDLPRERERPLLFLIRAHICIQKPRPKTGTPKLLVEMNSHNTLHCIHRGKVSQQVQNFLTG